MSSVVTIIAILVGGVTLVCLAGISWLAGATFKSMKMKERKQSQELNAQLLDMSQGGKDVTAELIRIRADLKDIKDLLQKSARPGLAADPSDAETASSEDSRELRQQ